MQIIIGRWIKCVIWTSNLKIHLFILRKLPLGCTFILIQQTGEWVKPLDSRKMMFTTFQVRAMSLMVIQVVKFSWKGQKIKQIFGQKQISSKKIIVFCELTQWRVVKKCQSLASKANFQPQKSRELLCFSHLRLSVQEHIFYIRYF